MTLELQKNNIEFIENANLKDFCTIKCDEKAKLIVFPKNTAQIKKVISICKLFDKQFFVLGAGSNLVFLENDYVFIKLSKLNQVKMSKNSVICGAGASLIDVCEKCQNFGLSGLEGLYGIPATVGGACVMNARAFGCEIADRISFVKCLTSDGKIVKYTKNQCNFAYKQSIFQNSNLIIFEVWFSLKEKNKEIIATKMQNFLNKRLKTQPVGFSAGCIFKNCHCVIAGKAIERLGFGGFKFRNFEVSKKHCNFILNSGNGKGKDLKILIEKIKRKMYNKRKIKLETEVIFVGET